MNKGQTYYLISQKEKQLAGTHIVAKNNRKIAIYTGSPLTRLPNGVSARDALFEQPMPVEYWGTQFIVTRSLGKNGNIIGITASTDGTEIKLDGYSQNPRIIIDEGDTYYIALQNAGDPQSNKPGNSPVPAQKTVTGDALFIETSCPCEVYSYDTGNGYTGKGIDELVNGQKGDPSSVWVSPIQQKINKITFGACYTNLTTAHFLNIVTETATCQQTKLTAYMGQYGNDWSNKLTWTQVPGNTTYSYARLQIGDNTPTINVFTLENTKGVIATIYGNGDDESYAYSAGSAAVEQGVNVNGVTFTNGYRSEDKFCFGDEITFDANVGTDKISRVDWNFGDGTTEYYGSAVTSHTYTTPGWFDVTAVLYGHQVCTVESDQLLGTVSFTFRVVRPDTVFGEIVPVCISLEDYKADPAKWDDSIAHPHIKEVHEHCYDTVKLNYVIYNRETEEFRDTIIGQDVAIGYNGKEYYASQDVVDTIPNPKEIRPEECFHFIRYYVKVIACLDITVDNKPVSQYACPGDNFTINYTKKKGDIAGKSILKIPGYADQEIDIPNRNVTDASLTIPVESVTKPGIYKAQLLIKDENCGDTKSFDIDFKVYYPQDIFAYKFINVLAVYKKGYGGNTGYEFVEYQWYRNGEAIPGATESIYHTEAPFIEGDVYYVELTDKNGMKLQSCPQEIKGVTEYPQPNAMPTQKQLINNRIYIIREGRTYDTYGQRVK